MSPNFCWFQLFRVIQYLSKYILNFPLGQKVVQCNMGVVPHNIIQRLSQKMRWQNGCIQMILSEHKIVWMNVSLPWSGYNHSIAEIRIAHRPICDLNVCLSPLSLVSCHSNVIKKSKRARSWRLKIFLGLFFEIH